VRGAAAQVDDMVRRLVEQGVVVGAHFVRLVGAHGLPERRA